MTLKYVNPLKSGDTAAAQERASMRIMDPILELTYGTRFSVTLARDYGGIVGWGGGQPSLGYFSASSFSLCVWFLLIYLSLSLLSSH